MPTDRSSRYPDPVPPGRRAPSRPVAIGGAIVAFLGVLIAVMGVVGGFGAFAARVGELTRIPAGESRTVVLAAGSQALYQVGAPAGFATTPAVSVLGPDGAAITITARSSDSFSGGSDRLRQLATFDAPTAGGYLVRVDAVEGATTDGVAVGPPYDDLATTSTGVLTIAVVVGGALFVVGIVAFVVGLSRRERAIDDGSAPT